MWNVCSDLFANIRVGRKFMVYLQLTQITSNILIAKEFKLNAFPEIQLL